jgi:diadenosine tetraphosphate (Ap4A) HIT family hydrolase
MIQSRQPDREEGLMSETAATWMPRERWEALVRGEGCPLCAELRSEEDADAWGYNIADLRASRLRLQANQYVTGYCLLVAKRHVREPYELSAADRQAFFEDLVEAGQALDAALNPTKMNFQILGNSVPHLHAHLVPRYHGDPAPGRPIDPDKRRITLTPAEYEERVARIRGQLSRRTDRSP